MENGRGFAPKRASWRSGSSDASSASVGCSGRSAYGQKRSVGRYFGESEAIEYLKGDSPRSGLRLGESIAYHSVDGRLPPHPLNRQASTTAVDPFARGTIRRNGRCRGTTYRRGRRA